MVVMVVVVALLAIDEWWWVKRRVAVVLEVVVAYGWMAARSYITWALGITVGVWVLLGVLAGMRGSRAFE